MERRPQHPTTGDAMIRTNQGDKGPGTGGNDEGANDVGETQEHTQIVMDAAFYCL